MLRFNKFLLSITAFIAITAVISISSCNKDNAASGEQKKVDEAAISALIDKMYIASDASGDAAITEAYQHLNAEEFASFNSLREKREMAKLEQEKSGNNEEELSHLKLSWNFRGEMDRLAVEQFGVHFNKLNLEQMRGIGEDAKASTRAKFAPSTLTNASNASVLACPLRVYNNGNACHVDPRGIGRYGWEYVINDAGEWPCDSEHKFGRYSYRIHGVDYASRQAILWYGCLGRRLPAVNGSIHTMVIIGAAGITAWVGLPGSLWAEMI